MSKTIYYLHINGDLICKPGTDQAADIRESEFAKGLWFLDTEDRASAWSLLVEANSAGAKKERILELAEKWGINDKDGHIYCDSIGVEVEMDGDAWCAHKTDFVDLQESPAGFGDTILDALSELCTELGYKPQRMWGDSFVRLVAA